LLTSAFYHICSFTHSKVIKEAHMPTKEYQVYAAGKEQLLVLLPEFILNEFVPGIPSAACTAGCSRVLKRLGTINSSFFVKEPIPP
jgi:hypothetical protein